MFKRLPYGLSNVPEIFQKYIIDDFISGLAGTLAYIDNIILYGKTLDERNTRLINMLTRVREHNVRFKLDKLQLAKNKKNCGPHDC